MAKTVNEALSALQVFEDTEHNPLVAKYAFMLFAKALENNSVSYEQIANQLYQMALEPPSCMLEEHTQAQMMNFSCALELAQAGYYGCLIEVKKQIVDFLTQYAGNQQ